MKLLKKKKCKCGRFILVARKREREFKECGVCKKYGLIESKRIFSALSA